jgi:hypothetical protein
MNAIHRITGYEKRTERLERALDVPADRLGEMIAIAIHQVSLKLGTTLNTDAYDWYLEPFSAQT